MAFQWQSDGGKRWWYMGYRWLLCIFLLYGLLYDWVLDDLDEIKCKGGSGVGCRAKWLVYCTNWAYTVQTAQALMAAYLATLHPATSNGEQIMTPASLCSHARHQCPASCIAYGSVLCLWLFYFDLALFR
jgi:hypothetical protein